MTDPLDTPEDLARRQEAVRATRGCLLPHHGLTAVGLTTVAAPLVQEAYDRA